MSPAVAAGVRMNFEEIREILPHRFPFIMLDRINALEPGSRITAIKNISGNEFQFVGHFPHMAVMPGVLIIESAAQAAGILLASDGDSARLRSGHHYLASTNMSFHAPVTPGDQMIIEAQICRRLGAFTIFRVRVSVEDMTVARGELTLAQTVDSQRG